MVGKDKISAVHLFYGLSPSPVWRRTYTKAFVSFSLGLQVAGCTAGSKPYPIYVLGGLARFTLFWLLVLAGLAKDVSALDIMNRFDRTEYSGSPIGCGIIVLY